MSCALTLPDGCACHHVSVTFRQEGQTAMTELEIDQSHLPRVQEVCQGFAVLEDGALAHNLQEQEIEQYYSTNIHKNQLVQNDIRMAKRLQDEEEQQKARQRELLSQASRQLEEQDSEYARMIQDEIQRCAEEEARRREMEDKEIAKRIQEEEDQRVRPRRRSSGQESLSDAGAGLRPVRACPRGAGLDLGDLQQVLLDEELARRLQQEEDKELSRSSQPPPSPCNSFPEADFRLAQVAQDEEIARFMQKQEIKSKRRSRELDVPGSLWREPREAAFPRDRRPPRERQRERLDSEGLPSPTEDYSPDPQPPGSTSPGQEPPSPTSRGCQPPSPTSTALAHPIRNIAEELDPTFRARTRGKESLRDGRTISGPPACQSHPTPQPGLHDSLEEPAFVPPTKRPSDKSARTKPKEKKENCKQQ